ncbi:hypothetical protein SBA3_2650025 [Candidatus Sulfopaludibacter sp. SbA3]|nr:hypothetical protein SBA3_2650025 [Candidatus Sulfopaludibacter sp. SbA3]
MAATSAELNSPMGVAVGLAGAIFIADTFNHRIRRVSGGSIATFAGTGISGTGAEGLSPQQTQLRGPRGVCADLGGTLYIVDTSNHRVLRAGLDGVVQTVAGNGAPGDAGDGGLARLAQLNQPSACTVDSLGSLFIADTRLHRRLPGQLVHRRHLQPSDPQGEQRRDHQHGRRHGPCRQCPGRNRGHGFSTQRAARRSGGRQRQSLHRGHGQ